MLNFRTNPTVLAVLLLIPFIQLGLDFYISIQILTFVLIVTLLNSRDFSLSIFVPASIASALMVMPLFFLPVTDLLTEALRVGRILLCMFILLLFLSNQKKTEFLDASAARLVFFIACALFVLVVVQQIAGFAGVLVYLPQDWYIANGENLTDEINLYYGLARPSATFGEPSYLGFVVFSLYVIALKAMKEGSVRSTCCLILWGTVIVSSTLAGLLSLIAITALHLYSERASTKLFLTFLLAAGIAVLGLFLFTPEKLIFRLENFGDSDMDASTYARLIQSFELLINVIGTYPFGIPTELLLANTGVDKSVTDNAVVMLFVNFGMAALIVAGLFLRLLWRRPIIGFYFLLSGMFNGNLFGYDKVAIIGLVFYLVGVERFGYRKHHAVTARDFGGESYNVRNNSFYIR